MKATERRKPPRRQSRPGRNAGQSGRIVVQNMIHPGKRRTVNAVRYEAMRQALMSVLPAAGPGLSLAEVSRAVLPRLPNRVFPGGAAAGWWLKTVQLDLEAKGLIARASTRPLRLHRC